MNFRKNLKIVAKRNTYFLIGAFITLIGYVLGYYQKSQIDLALPTSSPNANYSFAKVTKVFDGDTVGLSSGEKVRYIGIDSAEVYPEVQCFSEEAKMRNEALVMGKNVRLVKDISETDKYGRLLRYVYVGDDFINEDMVRDGYAKVMTIAPDTKYKNQFLNSENYAKENKLGLWSKCL